MFLSFLNSLNYKKVSYFDFYNLFCLLMASFVISSLRHSSFDSLFISLSFSIAIYQIYNLIINSSFVRGRAKTKKSDEEKVVFL